MACETNMPSSVGRKTLDKNGATTSKVKYELDQFLFVGNNKVTSPMKSVEESQSEYWDLFLLPR
jgi:hypothetical protein